MYSTVISLFRFPWPVIKKAHANGFMNVDIPTEYGRLLGLTVPVLTTFRWTQFGFGLKRHRQ